ncbi:MAG: hypothetical protein JWM46_200 [Candidatus Kaiserbacteria bacterium]|nr:hypothetical protein [Candidatus Kaiserbacteria bacterium]
MLPYRDSRITRVAIGIFFLVVVGYAYFELRGILFGPSVTVAGTASSTNDPSVSIAGSAQRISSLSLNGKAVTVTQTGAFDEPYLLAPGLNRIVLEAKDKYGRDTKQIISIVYIPAPAASSKPGTMSATSTATSTVAQ